MKGMVLEGGALRGIYTAGCLDVLMEKEIEVDGYAGVSAGVVFGANYKSGQAGRTIRYNIRYLKDPRYSGIRSLIKTGDLFGRDFCYNQIPNVLDPFDYEAFRANPVKLYAVATDALTGKPLYHELREGNESDLEWMRGSASMPGVSKAVRVDGYTILDGGISDSVPIEFMLSKGYEKIIVILTRPRGYRKKAKRLNPLVRRALRDWPAIISALERRSEEYNRELDLVDELEKQGKVLVLAPTEDLGVKRVEKNRDKVFALYCLARDDTLSRISEIREFLAL